MPPTPTPMTVAPVPLTLPSYDLWTFASNAVGTWNMFGDTMRQGVQWAIVAAIVVVGALVVIAAVRALSSSKEE